MIIAISRHAKAAKGKVDIERPLDKDGLAQRQHLHQSLTAREILPAAMILSSPALRAIQTVQDDAVGKHTVLPELYMPADQTTDGDEFDHLFQRHGYAPLAQYQEDDHTDVLNRWAKKALKAVQDAVFQNWRPGMNTVHIGCHAVLSNALAVAIIGGRNWDAIGHVTNHALGLGGTIIIYANTGQAKILELDDTELE